ncbi:hypothetical protein FGO68_gene17172 [Halteria grandinella]|uniref:Uncharacterized protein n=1 Tax=Halteria grandinella TaxID=5974 RepID=A0A8J8NE37_HALGN|nr:hypothetical protein FGO68_gene17172 [Halteria grandinella]
MQTFKAQSLLQNAINSTPSGPVALNYTTTTLNDYYKGLGGGKSMLSASHYKSQLLMNTTSPAINQLNTTKFLSTTKKSANSQSQRKRVMSHSQLDDTMAQQVQVEPIGRFNNEPISFYSVLSKKRKSGNIPTTNLKSGSRSESRDGIQKALNQTTSQVINNLKNCQIQSDKLGQKCKMMATTLNSSKIIDKKKLTKRSGTKDSIPLQLKVREKVVDISYQQSVKNQLTRLQDQSKPNTLPITRTELKSPQNRTPNLQNICLGLAYLASSKLINRLKLQRNNELQYGMDALKREIAQNHIQIQSKHYDSSASPATTQFSKTGRIGRGKSESIHFIAQTKTVRSFRHNDRITEMNEGEHDTSDNGKNSTYGEDTLHTLALLERIQADPTLRKKLDQMISMLSNIQ